MKTSLHMFAALAALLPLWGCNGILDGLYDEPSDSDNALTEGFVKASDGATPGTIFVDATAYDKWVYIDFSSLKTVTLDVAATAPAKWDLALHRYDAKTAGGAVATTSWSDFPDINRPLISDLDFVSDIFTEDVIITDMSHMMDGYLTYLPSDYNAALSKWLDVDKSTMPPAYTLSGKIYILRLADGSRAALRLTDFMDAAAVKGFLTIDYIYPLK